MTEVVSLVSKPTVEQEIKNDLVEMLRRTLAEAESGEISGVFMIVTRLDGDWSDRWTGITKMSDTIGRVEIIKQQLIHKYLSGEGENCHDLSPLTYHRIDFSRCRACHRESRQPDAGQSDEREGLASM